LTASTSPDRSINFFEGSYTLRKDDDDFGQPGTLVRKVLEASQRDRLVFNVVGHPRKA
jgi:catalase